MFFITWVDVWVREASLNFLMSFYRRKIHVEEICSFTPSFDQVQRHDESISAEWRRLENWKLSISDDAFPWDERLRYIYLWKKQIHHPYV